MHVRALDVSVRTLRTVLYERERFARMHRPARWFVREAGTLVEVVRLTRPHRERSLVLVDELGRRGAPWLVEARKLFRD